MSNNCLVKKLKGSVNNSNLPRFGAISLSIITREGVIPSSESQMLRINSNLGDTIKIVIEGDGHFTDSTLQEDYGKEYTNVAISDNRTVYFSPGNYKAYILGIKYGRTLIINTAYSLPSNSCVILDDIADLQYESSIRCQMRLAKGDIANLKNLHYSQIGIDLGELNEGDVYGNFNELGNAINDEPNSYIVLAKLQSVTGDIIDFVDTYINKGNTNSINLWLGGSGIKYNGESLPSSNFLIKNITTTSFEVEFDSTVDTWNKQGDEWVKV